MKELKLRGYVTPADCENDLQKALDTAKELDICKVVVERDITAGTVYIPAGMHLVLCNACVTANLVADGGENWSFSKKWINIEGENGAVCGNITFFNASNVTVTGLDIKGYVTLEYVNWARIIGLSTGNVTVCRGCTNIIIQKLFESDVEIYGHQSCGRIVPGSKPDITNVVVQDCEDGNVTLEAAPDCGLLNVQVQNLQGELGVGDPKNQLPPEQFMNLSFINIRGGIHEFNPTKHTYIK